MKAKMTVVAVLGLYVLCGSAWALDGLVSYWKLDEGQGTIAYDSVGTNDGTIHGAMWTTGQIDGALSFDGSNDYISVPHDPTLDITGDITISTWLYLNEGALYEGLVTKCRGRGSTNNPYDFRLTLSGLTLVRADESGHERVYSNLKIPLGEWHHGLVRVENNVPDFYVDGVITRKSADVIFTRTPTGNTKSVLIGARDDGLHFEGIIDDVIIFDRALSAEEIQQLYLSGVNNLDLVVTQIKNAIFEKIKAIERIDAGLEQDWAAYDALQQLLENGDYGDLNKGDIVAARQTINSAIQHQLQSIDTLQKSIEKLLYSLSALGYGPQPPGSNWPPNVTIIKPQDGDEFRPDDTIEIEADVLDFDGSVVTVEFFANGNKIAEDTDGTDGWTTSWSDHPEGTYALTATATDNEAAAATSAEVVITVAEEPPPIPPIPPIPPPIPPMPPGI
jgi:hypothetical protein